MDGDPVPSGTRKGSETWPTSINAEPAAGAGQVFSLGMLGHFPYGPLRPENAACRRGQLRAWALGESASTFLPFYQRICVTVTRRLFPKTKWQGFLFTSLQSQCIVANASENVKFLSPLVSTFSTE